MKASDAEAGGSAEVIREWLRGVVGGKRFVVAAGVVQECGGLAKQVLDLGASACFLLAGRVGTGPVPPPELGPQRVLGLPDGEMMDAIHAAERAFRALPDDVLAELEAFDPDHFLPGFRAALALAGVAEIAGACVALRFISSAALKK